VVIVTRLTRSWQSNASFDLDETPGTGQAPPGPLARQSQPLRRKPR
jgi:hypothetical protein